MHQVDDPRVGAKLLEGRSTRALHAPGSVDDAQRGGCARRMAKDALGRLSHQRTPQCGQQSAGNKGAGRPEPKEDRAQHSNGSPF